MCGRQKGKRSITRVNRLNEFTKLNGTTKLRGQQEALTARGLFHIPVERGVCPWIFVRVL